MCPSRGKGSVPRTSRGSYQGLEVSGTPMIIVKVTKGQEGPPIPNLYKLFLSRNRLAREEERKGSDGGSPAPSSTIPHQLHSKAWSHLGPSLCPAQDESGLFQQNKLLSPPTVQPPLDALPSINHFLIVLQKCISLQETLPSSDLTQPRSPPWGSVTSPLSPKPLLGVLCLECLFL